MEIILTCQQINQGYLKALLEMAGMSRNMSRVSQTGKKSGWLKERAGRTERRCLTMILSAHSAMSAGIQQEKQPSPSPAPSKLTERSLSFRALH